MATKFNAISFLARWLFAVVLVLGTYNPTAYSYVNWAFGESATFGPPLALVGVAVRYTLGGWGGKIGDARVILGGGLNDRFTRCEQAEAVLNGQKPGDDVFQRAADAISDSISPISDHRCSAEYRAHIGKVYVRRALQRATERLAGEEG